MEKLTPKKYRNEWKYRVPEYNLAALRNRLGALLATDEYADENGISLVRSLYFDDLYDTCARENDAKIASRHKYRIRYYNGNSEFIRLERKEKLNDRCHKTSCVLTRQQYDLILEERYEEVLWNTSNDLLRKFCIACMAKVYRPKVIIEYERYAYVEPISNIRITVDTNISASSDFEEFLTGNFRKTPVQEANQHVLEVKFDYILPSYVAAIVNEGSFVQSSFSKYYLGRVILQRQNR